MNIAKETMNEAYIRLHKKFADCLQQDKMSIFEMDVHEREKFLYATVMCLVTMEHKQAETEEEAEKTFELYDSVLTLMMALTPEQFERIFPIEKTFLPRWRNGRTWQTTASAVWTGCCSPSSNHLLTTGVLLTNTVCPLHTAVMV